MDLPAPGAAPLLSVVIVNWNTRDLLRAALDSIAGQSTADGDVELIVVDNGSADGSAEMVRSAFAAARVVANDRNRGFAAASNQGLAVARGAWILLLNSDAELCPDCLPAILGFGRAHPEAGIIGCQLLNPDGSLQPSGRAFPTLIDAVLGLLPVPAPVRRAIAPALVRRDYSVVAEVDEVSGAALAVRRQVLDCVGGLDEGFRFLGEDVDLCWRTRQAGWKVVYLPWARVVHRWGSSRAQQDRLRVYLLATRAQYRLLRKHAPRWQSRVFWVAVALVLPARLLKEAATLAVRGHLARIPGRFRGLWRDRGGGRVFPLSHRGGRGKG